VTAELKTLVVACDEEFQSLVTQLIDFSHRKIQVVAKLSIVLLPTKMSYMGQHFVYFYTVLLRVGPTGTPVLVYSMLLVTIVISGQ
jgi:hypothetical protein